MSDKRFFILLYAKNCEKYSWLPDDIGKQRCVAATRLLNQNLDSSIILGAGCEYLCIGKSVKNLSESISRYLIEILGCSKDRIITNPVGYNTVTETIAMVDVIGDIKTADIKVVSSWYHIPRIWLVWFFGYFKFVKCFYFEYDVERFSILHEFFGIPKSILEVIYNITFAVHKK